MKTNFIFWVALLAAFFSGCFGSPAMFKSGGESEVFDEASLKKISRICLIPVYVSPYSEIRNVDTHPITDSLWREIDSHKLFLLVPMDTVQMEARQISGDDSLFMMQLAQKLSADAYIKAAIVYSHPPGLAKTNSAALMLAIVDSHSDKSVVYSSFDTGTGKNYFLQAPSIKQVTADAIIGATQALSKVITKSRQQ